MKEELTKKEVLEAMTKCNLDCTLLLEERAKPKVWDGAPKTATIVDVY